MAFQYVFKVLAKHTVDTKLPITIRTFVFCPEK